MKLQDIKEIAKNKGIKDLKLKKAELIKAIQRSEGNVDCFGSANLNGCEQEECLWREDCVTKR